MTPSSLAAPPASPAPPSDATPAVPRPHETPPHVDSVHVRSTSWHPPNNPSGPALSRRQARDVLDKWGVAAGVDDAVLAVCEFVTNAVRAQASYIAVHLRVRNDLIRVEVHDSADGWPTAGVAEVDASSGRGLAIVAALARSWGCSATPVPAVKCVWAEIPVR
ncbi:ATP-binding protein [Streptomyces sioyaensis]|uniref:ATP-binding protein n=1 Tax=Streptomyces sioyaensis TaxID=67364 RepID=UPI0037AC38BE